MIGGGGGGKESKGRVTLYRVNGRSLGAISGDGGGGRRNEIVLPHGTRAEISTGNMDILSHSYD